MQIKEKIKMELRYTFYELLKMTDAQLAKIAFPNAIQTQYRKPNFSITPLQPDGSQYTGRVEILTANMPFLRKIYFQNSAIILYFNEQGKCFGQFHRNHQGIEVRGNTLGTRTILFKAAEYALEH